MSWWETIGLGETFGGGLLGDDKAIVTHPWDGKRLGITILGARTRDTWRVEIPDSMFLVEADLRRCEPDHVANMRRLVAGVLTNILGAGGKATLFGVFFHRDQDGRLHAWGWDVDPINGFDGWSPIGLEAAVEIAVPDDWEPGDAT